MPPGGQADLSYFRWCIGCVGHRIPLIVWGYDDQAESAAVKLFPAAPRDEGVSFPVDGVTELVADS